MEKATIQRWCVKEGDRIRKGDVLLELNTEKAAVEVEAFVSGTVRKLLAREGDELPVGAAIALVGEPDEPLPALPAGQPPAAVAEPQPAPAAAGTSAAFPPENAPSGAPSSPPLAQARLKPLSPVQKVMAERLSRSAREAPHFYVTADIDMTEAAALRKRLEPEFRCGYHDLVMRACALALTEQPEVHVTWRNGNVLLRDTVDIGLAVSLVDGGLVVPVIRGVERLNLRRLAAASAALIDKARRRQLGPDDSAEASLTLSNLGMYGVRSFQPVLNLGESMILGLGALRETAVVVASQIVVRTVMQATLGCDHRVLDGAGAARFLARLRELLEDPAQLL